MKTILKLVLITMCNITKISIKMKYILKEHLIIIQIHNSPNSQIKDLKNSICFMKYSNLNIEGHRKMEI